MPDLTANLGLKKPLDNETADIEVINENMDVLDEAVGSLSDLLTTEKENIVEAINELFTSVSNGKTSIASAITDKGVPASGSDTFAELAGKILNITISPIASIQQGTVEFIDEEYIEVTINEVDLTKAIATVNYVSLTDMTDHKRHVAITFVSSTKIRLRKKWQGDSFNRVLVSWCVTEYNNVKSLQRGNYSTTGLLTNFPITISSINVSKSLVFCSYITKTGSNTYGSRVAYWLGDSTTLRVRSSLIDHEIEWQVIEFN